MYFEDLKQFRLMNEVLILAEDISMTFIKGQEDKDLKKGIQKLCLDFKLMYGTYLEELGELECITQKVFEVELFFIEENMKEKQITQEQIMQNKLNENLYNMFAYKDLNKYNIIKQRPMKEIPVRSLFQI